MKNHDNMIAGSVPTVAVRFDLKGLSPSFDQYDQLLMIEMPVCTCKIVTPEFEAYISQQLGERQGAYLIDELYGMVQEQVAAKILASRMK